MAKVSWWESSRQCYQISISSTGWYQLFISTSITSTAKRSVNLSKLLVSTCRVRQINDSGLKSLNATSLGLVSVY